MYKSFIRPVLFQLDAESIHNYIVNTLHFYRYITPVRGLIRHFCQPSMAPFQWKGLTFPNRIGLSAGFDKEASCFDELGDFGFGFIEVGTVTPHPIKGNPSPRIFRLPKDNALISRTGFNNPGKEVFKTNLQRKQTGKYLLGININSNQPDNEIQVQTDILELYQYFSKHADYYTINWGSITPAILGNALKSLIPYKKEKNIPIFLKLPADLPLEKLDEVIHYAESHDIDGFIATGPTQDRNLLTNSDKEEVNKIGAGGISGAPISNKSIKIVQYLSQYAPKSMLIIGAGGIINETDAKNMIAAGTHVIQIYSSFIYEGPGIVKQMSKLYK